MLYPLRCISAAMNGFANAADKYRTTKDYLPFCRIGHGANPLGSS